jgi:hypothetical protein
MAVTTNLELVTQRAKSRDYLRDEYTEQVEM